MHRAAFGRRAVDRPEDVVEARLTDELRADVGFLPHLSLVAVDDYYRRFDFRPAAELGITAPDPAEGAHFQARRLTGPAVRGAFRYASPFERL